MRQNMLESNVCKETIVGIERQKRWDSKCWRKKCLEGDKWLGDKKHWDENIGMRQ